MNICLKYMSAQHLLVPMGSKPQFTQLQTGEYQVVIKSIPVE